MTDDARVAAPSSRLDGVSVLAVFAHPDDESIASGGLLAWCADLGARVTLLCATRGEGGPADEQAAVELGTIRVAELQDAAHVLGVAEVVLLDHPDGYLPWVAGRQVEVGIRSVIARVRPDVVITFDEDGLYWHPDHVAVHEAATAAVISFAAGAPALYYVTIPEGRMRRVVESAGAWDGGDETLLGIRDPDAFGAHAPAPTIVLETGVYARKKLAALNCHRTQTAGGPFTRLTAGAAERLLGTEHYRRAAVGNQESTVVERLAGAR